MPVPESSYSRRYGREDSTLYSSSYSRSTSTSALGGGRSSYLSYASKPTSTLPPRPPTYEYRSKYTDTNIGSRFLSNSASRVSTRDYGSNYRSSVSPVRASASSIRRQLEATAPSIAERIKAMELGETETDSAPTATRVSRLSTMRSRDSTKSSTYSPSSYSRDRSGSREYQKNSPLISSYSRGGDSTKTSTENLRNRRSPSTTNSGPLSRSGSGAGMKNGLSRLGSIEVNSENATSTASNGVTVIANTTTTSITTNPKTGSVMDDDDIDGDKCVKDVKNNDPNSVENSSIASCLISSAASPVELGGATINGYSSNNMNNDSEKDLPVATVTVSTGVVGGDSSSIAKKSSRTVPKSSGSPRVVSSSSKIEGSGLMKKSDECGSDSNGNPIPMATIVPPIKVDESLIIKGNGYGGSTRKGLNNSTTATPSGAKDSSNRLLKKCESDNNANNLQESQTCNGESSAPRREKSPYDAVLNYSPKSNSGSHKLIKSSSPPKVIYHTIQVEEEPRNSVSPEPVYTLTARPSLDGTGPKIEIKNVTKTKKTLLSSASTLSETVSAEFKVTLPKLKSAVSSASSSSTSSSENGHNNKSATNSGEEDAEEYLTNKLVTVIDVDSSNIKTPPEKSKENSPAPPSTISPKKESSPPTVGKYSPSSSTPDKQVKSRSSLTRRSLSKSRENTPTSSTINKSIITAKEKSPTPPITNTTTTSTEKSYAFEGKTNGEIHTDNNINSPDVMGPHSSKYTNGIQLDSSNRNERYGRSYGGSHNTVTTNNASDSSDNESDALTSSPRSTGSGRFRSKDGFEKAGLTGLRNIGNTCFMNTVLQCLSNTRPLLEYVMGNYDSDINRSTSGMKGALMRSFGELIHEVWRDQRVVDTSAFKDQIQRFAPRFMGYSQQDAQEFLRYLLEGLHEDVNRVTAKPTPITTDIDDSFSDGEKATESWRRYMRYESSRIVDMFVGQFKSTLRCQVCGHCSVTFDPFWDLSLPIPSRSSTVRLSQCFELLTKEEVLDGDEKPTCAKCNCRRKCTKSLAIQKFPKILVVHLKRFSLAERYRGKLSTLVDYPLNGLDLTQFAATRGNVGAYNLYGVANHSGSTYSGHYIAYCKHPYSNEWHCYNDSRVSPISSHSVVSPEGYVLFYEQVGQSSLL